MRQIIIILAVFVFCTDSIANNIEPMRERAKIINTLLKDRLENTLPKLMRRENIDMWVLISREYNEDPILKTMLPATWISARRRTILVLFDPGNDQPLQRWAISRYAVADVFDKAWDKEQQPDQWQALIELIKAKSPKTVAINKSEHFALADGITATEYQALSEYTKEFKIPLISSEPLALAWLETRSQLEMEYYPFITDLGHELIAKAFSSEVITPGVTSTDDVVWWLRQRSRELTLLNWFHPSVSVQRSDNVKFDHLKSFSEPDKAKIIQRGDLLHVDFGLQYLRLHSDQQQHAYVLKDGETQAPEYLQQALVQANRLQDIFTSNFKVGRSGNEMLSMSRQQAIEEGISPSIYTHPIGYHGHAAGTTLGMWDAQDGVPVQGDYPLHENTAYSIELNAAVFVSQWNKEIKIMLEEQAFFDGKKVEYFSGRQQKLLLVK